ncbi:glycosyltransferase [Pseudonocardia dioxanivorans CB1190]|jgi:galactofuranosylgalactofuranosylrhamnosyl-N-acetylglucosaminyl-diphospho-decaprenol beta-1,5/1,6-galactofuranosyltransferase|uniref:Glycosyltransferase n=1 Tax=Pseudonocardia dioxanivorans (strain ATCC 55486 / DSM 44775 / JCM 13855 / CB1190) TaxID=675635 RepID=F4CKB6_PSEUX|nr:glycosyltransferase [Pseudonocardia dioxanivorans]AEA22463.1 glycosyltransferase [Pseudonocardia dioxanivorans CB1190]
MAGSPGTTELPADETGIAPASEARTAGLGDPGAADRLLIQRGLFDGPSPLVPEDLYSVVEVGTARRERGGVVVMPDSRLSTNTYFGRVHATYWQRWTDVTELEVSLVVSGTGRVRVMASDTNRIPRIVAAQDVIEAEAVALRFEVRVDRFTDGGGLWLELGTGAGELAVSEVRWSVARTARPRPASMVICTFNRVDDCLNTLEALANDPEALAAIRTVYVVDQGSDPVESRPRFETVAARFGDQLVYLRQPNLGGAGGFTRGLFEVAGGPDADADTVFMDDDVLLEPEILIRLTAFANRTRNPMIVGGQMLNLLHPSRLHISAEYAVPEKLLAGQPVEDGMHDAMLLGVDEEGLPHVVERRVDTEYNGWWACLIPAEVVRRIGYPLPMFFQWDDVEYGYRGRAHGIATVSLPGAAVWHADFGWKDWDEWHRYFNIRNALVTAALHTGFSTRVVGAKLTEMLAQYLVGMQYGLAATLLQAVEDFLRGPEIMADGSAAAAAEIRRIRARYPETVMHPVGEIEKDFRELRVVRPAGPPGLPRATWFKRVTYLALDRAKDRTGYVTAGDAHWWHTSTFAKAYVTDMSEQGVRIRTRDRVLAAQLAKRAARTLRRLQKEAPSVVESYRAAMPELTSRANWARLYGVDENA